MDETNVLGLNHDDFTTVISKCTIVNVSKTWNEKDKEHKEANLAEKYVRKDNEISLKITFTLATTFLKSHASESRRCLAYFDA